MADHASPSSDAIRGARRRLLRWLALLRFLVDELSGILRDLPAVDRDAAMRAYPFTQPVGELGQAVHEWSEAACAAFATGELGVDADEGFHDPARAPLVLAAGGRPTFATVLVAFDQVTGSSSLAHIAAADFALSAAEFAHAATDGPAPPGTDPLPRVLDMLEMLRDDIASAAGVMEAVGDFAQPPLPGPVHAALAGRGSPFDVRSFAPDPALVALAGAQCSHCDRPVPRVDRLAVCQAMMIERDVAAPNTESGIASGYLSSDGWFMADTQTPAGYMPLCPDAIDIAADVRPLDLRYYRAYVEQFGRASGPIDSARRCACMLAVLRYDPFVASD